MIEWRCKRCGGTERSGTPGRCVACNRKAFRAWRAKNPEHAKTVRQAWEAENSAVMDAWRAANKERLTEYSKAWRAANPDRVRAMYRRSEAKRRAKAKTEP